MDHATETIVRWCHKYLLPAPSVEYIEEHELHADASSFDKKEEDEK
jgi:hypothetical protein